jgi:uncharacterized membrane protein
MIVPAWALTLAYWLHMLATVVWIGGLAGLSLFVLPAARKSLETERYTVFLSEIQRRLDPLAWFSLALLAATGLFQMSANPNYLGFLAIANTWAFAILIKHLLFLAMAGISAYLTWILLRDLRRTAMRRNLVEKSQLNRTLDDHSLNEREIRLLRLNMLLGILVLALTAVARASG